MSLFSVNVPIATVDPIDKATRKQHSSGGLHKNSFQNKISSASSLTTPNSWSCDHDEQQKLFPKGIQAGLLYEWGFGFGAGAYQLILPWVKSVSRQHHVLWVSPNSSMQLFPPALAAFGVSLENFRSAQTDEPVRELQAVFLEDCFQLIVLDRPQGLRKQDLAFIAARARKNRQVVFLLRPYLLRSSIPNPWASVRLNARFLSHRRLYLLEAIRGLPERQALIASQARGLAKCS